MSHPYPIIYVVEKLRVFGEMKMKKIRLDTPRRTDTSKNVSCQLVVIRDSKGKAVAYVSTTRHSTLVTIADLSDCVIDDATTTNAVCQS